LAFKIFLDLSPTNKRKLTTQNYTWKEKTMVVIIGAKRKRKTEVGDFDGLPVFVVVAVSAGFFVFQLPFVTFIANSFEAIYRLSFAPSSLCCRLFSPPFALSVDTHPFFHHLPCSGFGLKLEPCQ